MQVFFDIDTQIDFMYAAGALYGKGGEDLIAPVATLNNFAVRHVIPLVSTVCAHPEDAQEFRVWPPHCIRGTVGQLKPPALVHADRSVVPNEPFDTAGVNAAQVLLEKNDLDLFTNPNLKRLLQRWETTECVVYGAFTEYCVKCAVNGLLESGYKVRLVTDAIAALDAVQGAAIIQNFTAAGGTLTTVAEVLQSV